MWAKFIVETSLDTELTYPLGYEKNTPKTGTNTYNGYSSKTLLTDDGDIGLNTPREVDGAFESKLIKKPDTHHENGQTDSIFLR
jgi:putative transposase